MINARVGGTASIFDHLVEALAADFLPVETVCPCVRVEGQSHSMSSRFTPSFAAKPAIALRSRLAFSGLLSRNSVSSI